VSDRGLFWDLQTKQFVETREPAKLEILRTRGADRIVEVTDSACWEHFFSEKGGV
jgi:hypothetical protein